MWQTGQYIGIQAEVLSQFGAISYNINLMIATHRCRKDKLMAAAGKAILCIDDNVLIFTRRQLPKQDCIIKHTRACTTQKPQDCVTQARDNEIYNPLVANAVSYVVLRAKFVGTVTPIGTGHSARFSLCGDVRGTARAHFAQSTRNICRRKQNDTNNQLIFSQISDHHHASQIFRIQSPYTSYFKNLFSLIELFFPIVLSLKTRIHVLATILQT